MSSDDYDPWESDDLSPQDEYDRMTSEADANEAYYERNNYSYTNSNNSKSSEGCFIATAAFGSPIEKDVVSLKVFRDTTLLKFKIGRIFIKNYYATSPPIANIIKRSESAKATTRCLLKPIIMAVKLLNAYNK